MLGIILLLLTVTGSNGCNSGPEEELCRDALCAAICAGLNIVDGEAGWLPCLATCYEEYGRMGFCAALGIWEDNGANVPGFVNNAHGGRVPTWMHNHWNGRF